MSGGARQLILDLLARDKTGPASRSAAKNMDEVGESAEGAAKSTEHLGKESDKSDDKVQRLGKSSRTAAEHVSRLDHEIEACEHDLHQLAVAFAEAGTAAERADLSKSIRSTQRELKQLEKNKNVLKDLIPDEADAKKLGSTLSSVVGDAIENVKAGPVLAAGIAASAPLIGATISAAVIGAAGVGGVIGGVLLASKDPRVKAAGTELGKSLLGQLEKDAEPFVAPVLKAIDKVEAGFTAMNSRISHIFQGSSGFLGPLVDGALKGVDGILRGIDSLVTKGKPVIDQLGKSFGQLGQATGDALEVISGDSKDAATALQDLTDTISVVIEGTGYLVRGLTELYGPVTALPRAWKDAETSLLGWNDEAGKTSAASAAIEIAQKAMGGKVADTTVTIREQIDAFTDLSNRLKGETDPVFGMINAQDDLRSAQKATNDAAKEYGKNSPEYEAALRRQAEAALVLEAAAGKVATTSSGKLSPALRQTLIQAGFTKDEIHNLEKQFRSAKGAGDAFAKTYSAKMVADTSGAVAAMKRAKALYDQFRSKKITVDVYVRQTTSNKVDRQLDRYEHRAGGGDVNAGQAYIVGEKRPEVFVPKQDGTIIPSVSQASGGYSAAGMGSSSGGWVPIRGDALIADLTRAIAAQVSANGGRAAQLGIRFV